MNSKSILCVFFATLVGCASEQMTEPERYLPRSTPVPSPNALVIASRPTARQVFGPLVIAENESSEASDFGVAVGGRPAVVSASRANSVGDPIKVHVLNIGAGSCQIVECPDSDDVLIADCGSMKPSDDDMTRDAIAEYLTEIGANGEFIVTISHPHEDHYNRIVALMGDRKAKSIWLGGDFNGYGGDGINRIDTWLDDQSSQDVDIFDGWDPGFANRGLPVNELRCGSAETYILTVNEGNNPNANSLLLLVEYGNFRVIFSGDARGETEDGTMRNYGALIQDVSVLTSSHHGASTHSSNDTDWAQETAPQTVIFSSGLSHKHPKRVAGERYLGTVFPDVNEHDMWWDPNKLGTTSTFETRQAVYATEVSGRIVVESDGTEIGLTCEKNDVEVACF